MWSFVIFFLFRIIVISSDDFDDPEDEDLLPLFNTKLLRSIQDEVAQSDNIGKLDDLRHKIGVLAVYFRLYKELVPVKDGRGFRHMYPDTQNEINRKVATNCAEGLSSCIKFMFDYLHPIHPWLYPDPEKPEFATMEMSREMMEKLVNDNLLSMEVSASQVLCFFAHNEIAAFETIPFCGYGISANDIGGSPIWPGARLRANPSYIDDLPGTPYQCAIQSFCPDPCCTDVNPGSREFTERECHLNLCRRPETCSVESTLNTYLPSIRSNQWNISCPCEPGQSFRADIGQCVHDDICGSSTRCKEDEECINTVSGNGYRCICQLGYVKTETSICVPYNFSSEPWQGVALSDPHPKYALALRDQILIFSISLILVIL